MGQIQKHWQGKEEKKDSVSGRAGVMDPFDESGFQKVNRETRDLWNIAWFYLLVFNILKLS